MNLPPDIDLPGPHPSTRRTRTADRDRRRHRRADQLITSYEHPGRQGLLERLRPRPDRSGLTETAELVFVGIIASSIATWIVLWIGDLGFEPVIRRNFEYLEENPQLTATTVACVFAVSVALTGLAALVVFWRPGAEGTLRPGSTPWYDAPTRASRRRKVLVKVRLSDDTHVLGKLGSYTVDPGASAPDLVHPLITVETDDDAEPRRLNVDSLLIRGVEIRDVQIRYRDEGKRSSPPWDEPAGR